MSAGAAVNRAPDAGVPSSRARVLIAVVIGAALTLLWFAWLFAGPAPPSFLLSHYGTVAVTACGLAAIAVRYLPPARYEQAWAQLSFYLLALLLFGIPLAGMWSGGPYGYNLIAGVLPYSDAAAYEQGGRLLMENGHLGAWNSRRPLTAVFLGSLFTLGGGSLQTTQAVLVLVNAAAAFCAARALWGTHGLAAGLLMLATLFSFYYPHLGSLLSENLGLALGSTAFAFLWYGISNERRWAVAFGLFTLSIGLNARAGAFFVLPALIIWLSWRDFKIDRKTGVITLIWTGVAAALGFIPSMAVSAVFGSEQGIPFGNFAPPLYGLVVGGKGWTQVYADFPHISSLPESESFREIYRLAFKAAAENPQQILAGVGRYYSDYLFDTRWHRFFENKVLRGTALILTIIGIVHCFRRRRDPALMFLLITTVGVFASVPFLYDGAPRAYAATISVTAALIGIGFLSVTARIRKPAIPEAMDGRPPALAGFVTLVIVLLCAPSAWLYAGSAAGDLAFQPTPCPGGETAAVVNARHGSYVVVRSDAEQARMRLPIAAAGPIGRDFKEKYSIDLPSPALVARTRDRMTSRFAYAVVTGLEDAKAPPSRLELCGTWVHGEIFLGRVNHGR